jgi:hypothetical protein
MDSKDKKYSYNRFGMKGARVGQAVHDILTSKQETITAEEVLDEYSHKFVKELEDTINANEHKFKGNFYVYVISNKEMWAVNVVRNWFIARATAPDALEMVAEHPNHSKILYEVNKHTNEVKLKWTIPGIQDCISVLKNTGLYDPQLCQWIYDCFMGKLN